MRIFSNTFLEDFQANEGDSLEILGGVHIEPMGIYSTKYKSLDELQDGDEVMIPNDTTNSGRPLLLLQSKGIIKLSDDAGVDATEKDIVENPKNLVFKRLDAAAIPSTYDDAAIAAINGNYALEHGLNPLKMRLQWNRRTPYVNIVAVRKETKINRISGANQGFTKRKDRQFII